MEKKDRDKLWLNAADVAEIMGCGLTRAREIIRQLNGEMLEKGWIVSKRGWVSRKYFMERVYV